MKILITGGAGYIGSKLVKNLSNNKEYKISVIDNLMFDQKFLNTRDNVEFVKGDVRERDLYKELINNSDAIIPLAGLVGAPLCDKYPKETEEVNFEAIKFMSENLSKNQMVLMPVTNNGYGVGKKDKFCTEESPLNPISLYGRTKVAAEKIIMERENSISFRLATVFGVSDRMRVDLLVNNFTYIAYTEKFLKLFEPHFRRNYIHLNDVVEGFVFGIKNFDLLKSEIYNLGLSEANLTKQQLCEEIQKVITDFKFEISKDGFDADKRDYFVSNEKIEKKGFKAKTLLSDGIKELVNYFSTSDFKLTRNY